MTAIHHHESKFSTKLVLILRLITHDFGRLAGIGIYNGMRECISVAKLHRLDRARHQRIDRRKHYQISYVGVRPCVASHMLRSAALS